MSEDLRRAVDEHGWVVVPDRAGGVPTSSTVGLTASGLPELVVLGLPDDVAHTLLDEVARRLLDGLAVADGEPLDDLLDGPAPVLVTARSSAGAPATALYGELARLRQLVWRDAAGRLPWQEGADAAAQPLLGPPPQWPLEEDPHSQVLTSRRVAEEGAPVLVVVRTDDGELHFLDGASDFDPDRAHLECLHDALERDLSLLGAVRPLGDGEAAERDAPGEPWRVSPW